MLNNAPTILPAIEAELTHGPAALRELSNALRWKGVRTNDAEIEAAIAVLVERGKVEARPAARERNTKYAATS